MMTQKLKAERQRREEIVRMLLKMSSFSLLAGVIEKVRFKIAKIHCFSFELLSICKKINLLTNYGWLKLVFLTFMKLGKASRKLNCNSHF